MVKIHFHTNEPWKVLEYCNSVGEIYDIGLLMQMVIPKETTFTDESRGYATGYPVGL